MFNWPVAGLLMLAGIVASWVVAKESPQFVIMQLAVMMLLFALIMAIFALWPERWNPFVRLRIWRKRDV